MIEVKNLVKRFGAVTALDGVSITVPVGTVLGLLGHNGAGKTTLINILSTVIPPDQGNARVAGWDVVRESRQVRSRIGLTGQFAAVDERLTGMDNLVLVARLLGAGRRAARARAVELIDVFDLGGAARRVARGYSGGMRRRLDIAASLVGDPEVVFLDEPTSGLDPESRLAVWEITERLVADGTTVLLTTQYLEEADRLADDIVVLGGGRVVASGSAAELKATIDKRMVHVRLAGPNQPVAALASLAAAAYTGICGEQPGTLTVPVQGSGDLVGVIRALDRAGVDVADLSYTEPTLQDVYLSLSRSRSCHDSP